MHGDLARDATKVVDLLRKAKRPLIHVGQGVRLAGAIPVFMNFVESQDLPFITARNANDICDDRYPNYIGRAGTFAQRGANFAVQCCDLYIAIGTRLSLAQTGYNAKDYARNAKIVMVDIDAAELRKDTVPLHLAIQADAKDFLIELQSQLGLFQEQSADRFFWMAKCKNLQMHYPVVTKEYREQKEFVNSYHFADVLSDALTPEDVIVTDMGFAFQNMHQAFKVKKGQRFFTNCGMAAMGWGLPAAIGACLGSGRKRTICVTGDGGFMFNVQELATIAHHKLPIKIFILNNGGYLTMRQSQDNAFDGYMGSDASSGLGFPDFCTLAEAFGLYYDKFTNHKNLDLRLEYFLDQQGPAICELMMHPDQEALKSVNRRLPDGTIQQTAIEDAYPYLPKEEIEEWLRCAK